MTRKERFMALLNKHGYPSLNNFCIENKLQQANFHRRLNNEDIMIDMQTIFNIARILKEPYEVLVELFYPDEVQENRSLIDENEREG